jgi:hypothetical protein
MFVTSNASWRFFERHDITFKKSLHASEQDRVDVRMARADWKREQPRLDPKKLIFIDETGTSTNITRLWAAASAGSGWWPRGWKFPTHSSSLSGST